MTAPASLLDWRSLVAESWPAVPAYDLLVDSDSIWSSEGLGPPGDEEAVALAVAGKLVRYGQSVSITLPIARDTTLPRLAFYLHRLRLDAAQGLLRSPWLNRIKMAERRDLIVFGRPQRMLRDFASSIVMRPTIVSAHAPLADAASQRTLLANGHGDLMNTLELLEERSHPFAIVVDVTAAGCDDNSVGLIKALADTFGGVPIVALGFTGQFLSEPLKMHAWNVRLGDQVPLTRRHRQQAAESFELVAPRDQTMNSFAKRLGFLVWNLKRMMESAGGKSAEFVALSALDRTLRHLNVPLSVHDRITTRHVRGGRFAVRTIDGWLELAARMRGRRGDIQALLDEILALVRSNLKQLYESIPGRGELLLSFCAKAISHRSPLAILVGTSREALILQEWIEAELGPEAIQFVSTLAMDGSTAIPPDEAETVIYASSMFPSRLHWLGLRSDRRIVLCHPFEQQRVQRQLHSWCCANALPSKVDGDKSRLWRLDWRPDSPLRDLITEELKPDRVFANYEELVFDGRYPLPMRLVQVESSRRFEDWLDALLTQPAHADSTEHETEEAPEGEMVVVHLHGHTEVLRWPTARKIMRLRGEAFDVCLVQDLAAGDDLVLLANSKNRAATQREIFDMFVQNNHGLQQTALVAEKWQEYVDRGVAKLKTVAELTRYLKGRRFSITPSAVQQWYAGRVIGPENPVAIRLLAELLEVPFAERMAMMIGNAIRIIRSEHRDIGSDLRKAVALTRRDRKSTRLNSSHRP